MQARLFADVFVGRCRYFANVVRCPLVRAFNQGCERLLEGLIIVGATKLALRVKLAERHATPRARQVVRGAESGFLFDEMLDDFVGRRVLLDDHSFLLGAVLTKMTLLFFGHRIRDVNGGLGLLTTLTNRTHRRTAPDTLCGTVLTDFASLRGYPSRRLSVPARNLPNL